MQNLQDFVNSARGTFRARRIFKKEKWDECALGNIAGKEILPLAREEERNGIPRSYYVTKMKISFPRRFLARREFSLLLGGSDPYGTSANRHKQISKLQV